MDGRLEIAQTIIQNLFDQLTQYEIVDGTAPDGTAYQTVNTESIIGMIAESWEYDPADTSVMVFKVRPGVTYANGNPIDANTLVEVTSAFSTPVFPSSC